MAIDDAYKRASMLHFSDFDVQILQQVDGLGQIEPKDRAHLLNLYSGNALSSPGGTQYPTGSLSLLGVGL